MVPKQKILFPTSITKEKANVSYLKNIDKFFSKLKWKGIILKHKYFK